MKTTKHKLILFLILTLPVLFLSACLELSDADWELVEIAFESWAEENGLLENDQWQPDGVVVKAVENTVGNMTNKEFLGMVGSIAGVPDVAKNEVSGKTMLRVARFVELLSKVTGRAPMTTYKNTLYILQHGYVDPAKAVRELGLPQTPIETAVADSVQWFRENGYV